MPGSPRLSDPDRRQASSASDGCAGSPTSTSSSSTTRTYAEPTVAVLERTSMRWTRPFGATSVVRPGSSHGECAVQDSSFNGRGPLRPFEPGEGTPLPASPDLLASCCSTSSGGRGRHMSRWVGLPRRSKRCDALGSACKQQAGSHPGRIRPRGLTDSLTLRGRASAHAMEAAGQSSSRRRSQTRSPTSTIACATVRRLAWLLRACPRMSW